MINLNLYGCSFTQNIFCGPCHKYIKKISNEISVKNHGKISNSNLKILNSFKETLLPDSISVIQWSALTRPNDSNFSLMETSNPLWDLLDEWYTFIDTAIELALQNNIKLIQYTGWAHWRDDELNDYHRNKLNSYNIHWFHSKSKLDMIQSNCFQFQLPRLWSSTKFENGLYLWPELIWGGMSEWIRENIDIKNRYVGYNHGAPSKHFDSHPSEYATHQFVKQFLIPKVKLINNLNELIL